MHPKITDSIIIFSNQFYHDQPEIFKGYNRFDIKKRWTWKFPHKKGGADYIASRHRNTIISGHNLIFSIATYYYNLDIRNGTVNAETRMLEYAHNARINVYDKKLYFTTQPWQPDRGQATIWVSDLSFSEVDTIVQIKRTSEGEWDPVLSIEPPSFWIRPDGDTIGVYVLRGYNGAVHKILEIHALNVSKPGYPELWAQDTLPYDENCNVVAEPIFYQDSILVFPGQNAVHGLSLRTGEVLYNTIIPEDLLTTDFILVDDRVVFVDNSGNFHILDPLTGEILAIIPDLGGNVSNMEHHDGIVYYTSAGDGKLYAVDINREKVVWEWKSPHRNEQSYAQFTFAGVAIDSINEWLYTSDRVYAMCLKLYEEK